MDELTENKIINNQIMIINILAALANKLVNENFIYIDKGSCYIQPETYKVIWNGDRPCASSSPLVTSATN